MVFSIETVVMVVVGWEVIIYRDAASIMWLFVARRCIGSSAPAPALIVDGVTWSIRVFLFWTALIAMAWLSILHGVGNHITDSFCTV
jgi:hypothetical protein